MGVLGLSEKASLDDTICQREAGQLTSLGKLRHTPEKLRVQVLREAFVHMVPSDQEWSSMAIFEGVLRGKFKPLYDIKGRPQSLARMPEPDSSESGDER